MPGSIAVLDFSNDETLPPVGHRSVKELKGSETPMTFGAKGGIIGRPVRSRSPKQIRARARRKMLVGKEELMILYGGRDVDEWDAEELARGRPRAKDGSFKGAAPSYLDRTVHEKIVKRFTEIVRTEMNTHTVDALKVISLILNDKTVDEKGKPITAAGTKLDAAKFLIEHVVGKPTQRQETDISIKLESILGGAMVNPGADGQYVLTQGYIEADAWEVDDDVSSSD